MNIVNLEHQSIIRFFIRKGSGPKVIHECRLAVYGDAASCKYQVNYWSEELKWNKESVKNYTCHGISVEVTTPEMLQELKSWLAKQAV
jgi:hypothetical protein